MALAADAAGIARPDTNYRPDRYTLSPQHHASFYAYEEFMANHLGLQRAGGCHGGGNNLMGALGPVLFLLLFPPLLVRMPAFYWFRGRRADPYDMGAVYKEFEMRAAIGKEPRSRICRRPRRRGRRRRGRGEPREGGCEGRGCTRLPA